ncbi:transglycosylase SLT domain-containing protein [Piscirickettsia litoralis]|uniref:Transglycosylase SLT domain-containing protein n=1 Tax=Piscirickettsia litoralis TaxID=1891921 RepID=A0ABX3A1R8_9GAMM|nr:transglycosylase SLT domain-containing protein [Piscirickettsia litoralis]ODN42172.1 hypothetical protein BGC07_03455 [Piscirickettsia litoralis]
MKFQGSNLKLIALFIVPLILTGCATAPPQNINNICSIFREYPKWYWAAKDSRKKWGVPISTQMAIIYYESHFRYDAQPPRTTLLGFIPWSRPTSAYGYAQATDGTWAAYQRATGNTSASRTDFADAIDFVGWYANRSSSRLGIARNNAYSLYLAYHEGDGGYRSRSYLKKRWLLDKAHQVRNKANSYYSQLIRCESSLPKNRGGFGKNQK